MPKEILFIVTAILWILSFVLSLLGVSTWLFDPIILASVNIIALYLLVTLWIMYYAPQEAFLKKWFENYFFRWAPYVFLAILSLVTAAEYFTDYASETYFVIFALAGIIVGLASLQGNSHVDASVDKEKGSSRNFRIALISFFILLLAVYIYHIFAIHFVDSDETRLLYDGRLITQGLIPFRDFSARAPALIYMIAGLYRFLGNTIWHYYVIAAIAFWFSVILVYILSRRFVSRMQSVMIMAAYAVMPLVLNFLYLKTQTFEIPFVLLSIILFTYSMDRGQDRWARLCSHLCMLIALFIRPSAVFFYIFHLVILLYHIYGSEHAQKIHRVERKAAIRAITALCLEAFAVVAVFMALTLLFFSNSNMLFYTSPLKSLFIDDVSGWRFSLTIHYIPFPILIVALAVVLGSLFIKGLHRIRFLAAAVALILVLSIVYFINALVLGFWPQYYMEFSFAAAVLVSYGIVLISKKVESRHQKTFAAVFVCILLISCIPGYVPLQQTLGIYGIHDIDAIASEVDSILPPDGTLFAGNPVFAFASDRPMYLDLTHSYYDPDSIDRVMQAMALKKPDMIIRDTYVEEYYMPDPRFDAMLVSCYTNIDNFNQQERGRISWVIGVYVLKDSCR